MKIFVKRLVLALASLCAFGLVAELGAQVWLHRMASKKQFKRYASYADLQERQDSLSFIQPHRYMTVIPTPNWKTAKNRHNALGLRGEEVALEKDPGEFRIACLGGSTTYTSSVREWDKAYPAVLQSLLRERGHQEVTVLNGGVHGWRTWETLAGFQFRILELQPDVVVVYHAYNDLIARIVWPPEAYRSDNGGTVTPPKAAFMPPFWEYSAALRIMALETGQLVPHNDLERTAYSLPETNYWHELRLQAMAQNYPQSFFVKHDAETLLAENSPRWFESNLRSLICIAEDRGIEVVLATFAWNRQGSFSSGEGGRIITAALEEMNETTRRLGKETGARVFDFAASFPSEARYFTDDVHMNAEGAALKATLFADFLEPEFFEN